MAVNLAGGCPFSGHSTHPTDLLCLLPFVLSVKLSKKICSTDYSPIENVFHREEQIKKQFGQSEAGHHI